MSWWDCRWCNIFQRPIPCTRNHSSIPVYPAHWHIYAYSHGFNIQYLTQLSIHRTAGGPWYIYTLVSVYSVVETTSRDWLMLNRQSVRVNHTRIKRVTDHLIMGCGSECRWRGRTRGPEQNWASVYESDHQHELSSTWHTVAFVFLRRGSWGYPPGSPPRPPTDHDHFNNWRRWNTKTKTR